MQRKRLIGPLARSSTSAPKSALGDVCPIPDDLLRQASQRLGIVALVGAGLWFFAPALAHVAAFVQSPGDPRWAQFKATDYIAMGSIAISLALFLYTRKGDRDPTFVTDLGLVYLVAMAFAIGFMMHMGPISLKVVDTSPMITWIGPVTLMVAAIVPVPPWKMFIAGLLSASMDPLGMLIARAAGTFRFDSVSSAFLMHYPNYLLLGVAVLISHVVTRLGRQVAREREMGSYRLGDLLGRGGMGEVYQATHRMLARPAAIKLIRPRDDGRDNGDAAHLAVEALPPRGGGGGQPALTPHGRALRLRSDGGPDTLLRDGAAGGDDARGAGSPAWPVPAGRVIHILQQICESLEEAHARGLVHRDIKPANIHVGRVGLRYDFVKVLDFGLVKSVVGASDEDSLATAAGLTPGTPAYMAPETTRGDTVDGQADIYALGCVAYYLLTGQLVFDADNAYQMIAKHLSARPVPPSQRANVRVPAELERLVLACLSKEPAERPSAAALHRSLAAVDVEQWTEEDAKEWWREKSPDHPGVSPSMT